MHILVEKDHILFKAMVKTTPTPKRNKKTSPFQLPKCLLSFKFCCASGTSSTRLVYKRVPADMLMKVAMKERDSRGFAFVKGILCMKMKAAPRTQARVQPAT